jgi:hypothetical protein
LFGCLYTVTKKVVSVSLCVFVPLRKNTRVIPCHGPSLKELIPNSSRRSRPIIMSYRLSLSFRRHTCSTNISPFVKLGEREKSDIFDSLWTPVLSSILYSYGFCFFNLVTNLLLIRVAPPQPVSNRIQNVWSSWVYASVGGMQET